MEFTGEFETHITVKLNTDERLPELREWGTAHGLKCVHIVLDRGATVSQPMLTRRGQGTLSAELAEAHRLRTLLENDGFIVNRLKIEAAPWNQDVPQSDADRSRHTADRHFEHHIKLLLGPDADIPTLTIVAEKHTAHLSRNAFRQRTDGFHERFVSQRCFIGGQITARQELAALLADLRKLPHTILDVEEEFVVFDSNIGVDGGWIDVNATGKVAKHNERSSGFH